MTRRWLCSLLMTVATIHFGGVAYAQVEQGTITGTVMDEGGGVIPGASVTVTQVETGTVRDTVTNGEGHYTVPYLPVGTYDVAAELAGFSRARATGVAMRVGLTATIDLTLKTGTVQTEITVTADVAQLELQSASLGNVISGRQMLELPIVGRNPYSLITQAPGVADRGNTGTGPLVNGSRSNSTAILLDGAEQRNSTTNDANYTPPLESVQEFKVLTNGLSAEFGRTGGGVITAATRSGTNAFHGSGYGYIRRDKFNANTWANNRAVPARARPAQHNDDYGFSLGGPLVKDRTFFFVNVERNKAQNPQDLLATVPTLLERQGNFSQTFDSAGRLITIYDPLTTRLVSGTTYTRDPFPGNIIPANRIDPVAKAILEYFPLPTDNTKSTDNFFFPRTRTSSTTPIVGRLDHMWGQHHLFASFRHTNVGDLSPGVNVAFPDPGTNGEAGQRSFKGRSAVLSDSIFFRPNLIGEFRLSYTRRHFTTNPHTLGFDPLSLGIGSADPAFASHVGVAMFPKIEVRGPNLADLGLNRAGLIDDLEDTRELSAHVTWIKGSHTLKSGLSGARIGFDVFRPEYQSGLFQFNQGFTQGPDPSKANSPTPAGAGFASFLLGLPSGGRITDDPTYNASQMYWAPYIQDDWKVTNNLTVNLGLRYEYQTPWSEKNDQLTFFDPVALDPLTGRPGVIRFVAQDGASRYQTDPDRNNFAPRLGFAWHLQEETVLRGGYGIVFYPGSGGVGAAPSDLGSGGFLVQNDVFLGQLTGALANAQNTPPPGASLANPFAAGYFAPPSTLVGGGVSTAFRDLTTPYAHTWNVNVQRQLPWDMIAEVAYVGTRGKELWSNLNRNSLPASVLTDVGETGLITKVPNPFFGVIKSGSLSTSTVAAAQLMKPFPHYADVTRFRDSVGESWYNGLTLRLERRPAKGLAYQVAYTLSKEEDTVPERFGSRASLISDSLNLSTSRAVAEDDRTHVISGNFIWSLPVGPGQRWANSGVLSHIVGGWRLSGVGIWATGRPLVLRNVGGSMGSTGLNPYANIVGDIVVPADKQSLDLWFNSSKLPASDPKNTTGLDPAIKQAAKFTLGNGKRTYPEVRGPKVQRLDLMLSRLQKIGPTNLEFRVEAQNALNTPQFGEPEGNFTSGNFGKITTAGLERRLQLGLRLGF